MSGGEFFLVFILLPPGLLMGWIWLNEQLDERKRRKQGIEREKRLADERAKRLAEKQAAKSKPPRSPVRESWLGDGWAAKESPMPRATTPPSGPYRIKPRAITPPSGPYRMRAGKVIKPPEAEPKPKPDTRVELFSERIKRTKAGFVYVLNSEGIYKIGKSGYEQIGARLKRLKVHGYCNDPQTELVGRFLVPGYSKFETSLHKRYERVRIPQSEWFRLSPGQLEELLAVLAHNQLPTKDQRVS